MQTVITQLGPWFLALALLGVAPAFAQSADGSAFGADDATSPQEGGSASFRQNRESFQAQKNALETAVLRIDSEIKLQEGTLQALAIERSKLVTAIESSAPTETGSLDAVTNALENFAVAVLNPAAYYVSGLRNTRAPGATVGSNPTKKIVSFVFPVMVLLTFLLIRQRYFNFYREYARYLNLLLVFLMLVFPVSSFAQQPIAVAKQGGSLAQTLAGADEVLRLSRAQRYIKLLVDADNRGKRIRISDVDFRDVPVPHFESFVVGSGEYYVTLAALYLADGKQAAAIAQLRPLALADTRYASKKSDHDSFEGLISRSAAFLFRSDQAGLALDIVQRHMHEFRQRSSFESLYPELMRSGNMTAAVELAERVISYSTNAGELLAYSRMLFQTGVVAPANASLKKALEFVLSPSLLVEIIDTGLARNATQVAKDSVDTAQELVADAAIAFSIAEKLSAGGYAEEPRRLLDAMITRAATGSSVLVDGDRVSATDALVYLSLEAFKRGYFGIAERAGLEALKPLSSAERRALPMPLAPSEVDPLRVPYPHKLVAPLYFGLLYEKQGRPRAAKARFQAESRRLIDSLVDSHGLYVPEMMNHLALLGSVLDPHRDSAELAKLNSVLAFFETRALYEIRVLNADAIDRRSERLEELQAQVLASRAEVSELQGQLDLVNSARAGSATSTVLLLLRTLGIIVLALFYSLGAAGMAAAYASSQAGQRAAAFCWKFLESVGWIWAVSLFSLPLGLAFITMAQYFLRNREHNEEQPEFPLSVDSSFEDTFGVADESCPYTPSDSHAYTYGERHIASHVESQVGIPADLDAGPNPDLSSDIGSREAATNAAAAEAKVDASESSKLRGEARVRQWEDVVEMLRDTRK